MVLRGLPKCMLEIPPILLFASEPASQLLLFKCSLATSHKSSQANTHFQEIVFLFY